MKLKQVLQCSGLMTQLYAHLFIRKFQKYGHHAIGIVLDMQI